MSRSDIGHSVSARFEIPAENAYAFLVDPVALSRWSLGCMDLEDVGEGVFRGRSLFDGAYGWLSIDGDPKRLLIDYHVGTATERHPRICARVTPGPVCGLPTTCCIVTLSAWRSATMTDERWHRLCATHEAEIWLIKAQAEALRRGSADR
jgi:hypothetical protein